MKEISDLAPAISLCSFLIGGIAWLTRLHQIALENRRSILELRREILDERKSISSRIEELEKLTGKIDGKLDLMMKFLERNK